MPDAGRLMLTKSVFFTKVYKDTKNGLFHLMKRGKLSESECSEFQNLQNLICASVSSLAD
jgi:hypothetical protein